MQQSVASLHPCPGPEHRQVPFPQPVRLQQSAFWKQGLPEMPQQVCEKQVCPSQQSPVALQGWPETAQTHCPFAHSPLQQSDPSSQGPPETTQQLPLQPRPAQHDGPPPHGKCSRRQPPPLAAPPVGLEPVAPPPAPLPVPFPTDAPPFPAEAPPLPADALPLLADGLPLLPPAPFAPDDCPDSK